MGLNQPWALFLLTEAESGIFLGSLALKTLNQVTDLLSLCFSQRWMVGAGDTDEFVVPWLPASFLLSGGGKGAQPLGAQFPPPQQASRSDLRKADLMLELLTAGI